MATATRVAGDEEDEGVEEGNESFILNWNKMFERRGWWATKRARATATAARATATAARETATRARDGDEGDGNGDNVGDGDGDKGGG